MFCATLLPSTRYIQLHDGANVTCKYLVAIADTIYLICMSAFFQCFTSEVLELLVSNIWWQFYSSQNSKSSWDDPLCLWLSCLLTSLCLLLFPFISSSSPSEPLFSIDYVQQYANVQMHRCSICKIGITTQVQHRHTDSTFWSPTQ